MKFNAVSTTAYFDCNATTPTHPAAAEAAMQAMKSLFGNPSSTHLVGLQAKAVLESTRRTAGNVIGCHPDQIIFTSGATEAIQTAIFSALVEIRGKGKKGVKLLYGATEHKAVPTALQHWVKALNLPYEIIELPVDALGQIRQDVLREHLPKAALVCTMAVNNETGVIQDLEAIKKILQGSDAFWLVDCVQALGKIKLSMDDSRIDYATFSGHKLYAPKGTGFLYVSKRAPLTPLIVGGGQERGLRSGTENLPGVAALGAVLELLPFASNGQLVEFRNRLVTALRRAFPKIEFNTPAKHAVPTTINFCIPGFSSKEIMDLFDSAGMRLSAGSACNSASVKSSHVLDAMGLPEWKSSSALRLSFGPLTSEREIERGCRVVRESAMALQSSCLLEVPGGFQPPENLRDGIIQLRAGSTNTWIITHREARTCIIIDPCATLAERTEHYIRCQNLKVIGILDTHSHADHESIRPVLQKLLSSNLQCPTAPCDSLGWPVEDGVTETIKLGDGTQVPALHLGGDLFLAKLQTPGHTLDSHALILGRLRHGRIRPKDIRFVFCGDTILSGGLGRTNFLISDPKALFESLQKVHSLVDPLSLLCPTHDYTNSFATSMETEVRENPLLALAINERPTSEIPGVMELFIEKKREIDRKLDELEQEFQGIVCGVFQPETFVSKGEITITLRALQQSLQGASGCLPLLIDVREPQEVALFKNWETLGLTVIPRNVPLSRFVNFMGELASEENHEREVVLICRSGARSLHAAKTLRRMKLARARSLLDGIALTS